MPALEIYRGTDQRLKVPLEREYRLSFGSDNDNDYPIPCAEVLPKECLLEKSENGWMVKDLSGRGTVMNGLSWGCAMLRDGDEIRFGEWRIVFTNKNRKTGPGSGDGTVQNNE